MNYWDRARLPAGCEGALGERLTLSELSDLRAATPSGRDPAVFERVLTFMQALIAGGHLTVEVREHRVRTGGYRFVQPYSYELHGPLDPGIEARRRIGNSSEGLLPPGAEWDTHLLRTEYVVTRDQAHQLRALDPDDWSEASLRWLGVIAGIANATGGRAQEKTLQRLELERRYSPQQGGVSVSWHHVFKALGGATKAKSRVPGGKGLYYLDRFIAEARSAGLDLVEQSGSALRDVWPRDTTRHKMKR